MNVTSALIWLDELLRYGRTCSVPVGVGMTEPDLATAAVRRNESGRLPEGIERVVLGRRERFSPSATERKQRTAHSSPSAMAERSMGKLC